MKSESGDGRRGKGKEGGEEWGRGEEGRSTRDNNK